MTWAGRPPAVEGKAGKHCGGVYVVVYGWRAMAPLVVVVVVAASASAAVVVVVVVVLGD